MDLKKNSKPVYFRANLHPKILKDSLNKERQKQISNFEFIQEQKKYHSSKYVPNVQYELGGAQEKCFGYEMTVRITKENSYDLSKKAMLIEFIEKFYLNGYFKLSHYFPYRLGEEQKADLENKFRDLQLQIKEMQFEKADYLFYQQIYQFKGQEMFDITPALQMLIFEQSIFRELANDAQKSGLVFSCNFTNFECSIPPPKDTIHDAKYHIQYFVNNVQAKLDKYEIIAVETQTKQESNIIYKLVKQYQEQISKVLNSQIFPVIINLRELEHRDEKQMPKQCINQIIQTLKYDKLYLVVEKTNQDLNLLYSEFKKFIKNKDNIKYHIQKKLIQFCETQENQILQQQLEDLQENFQQVSIRVSQPKLIDSDKFEVQVYCETWLDPKNNTFNFMEECSNIEATLFQIYNPYVQINLDQSEKYIWQQYLKGELDKSLNEYIIEDYRRTNKNENHNVFTVKISTKFPKFEEEIQRIKQQLEELCQTTIEIQNDKLQLQSLIEQICKNNFEKIVNNFQQQEKGKIAQIKFLGIQQGKFQFTVIYYCRYTKNQIQNLIKRAFIDDLTYNIIDIPFLSILQHLNEEFPKLIQEKGILPYIPQGNAQQVILIGRRSNIEQIQIDIEDMKEKFNKNKMEIKLLINQKSLADEICEKLNQHQFCTQNYDTKTQLLIIEFFQQDFQNIYKSLKDLEKSYGILKVYHLDGNQIEHDSIIEIEKKEQVIIDVKNIPTIDPNSAEGFLLNTGNNAKIKFIKGNISQIQCQAIVLEFVKNVDFSKEIIQNDQVKNIKNLIEGEEIKKKIFWQWKQLSKEKDIEDVFTLELSNQKHLKYIFQVYPKFYRNSANLEASLEHIKSLITQVFQKCKNFKITQIAFPLIGCGLFGFTLNSIQQILIQEITSQLSSQNCTISSVFVMIQDESDYQQVQQYCKSVSNSSKTTQVDYFQQTMNSLKNQCCQIEIGGDLIDIEDFDANVINQRGEKDNFPIIYPYSKFPFTHSIDLKNNKMIEKNTKIEKTIQFIDLFKQRIYFIDNQQVSQCLNQYLIIKHELSKQNEVFEIYYAQDEVQMKDNQPYIKTNGFDDFKKVIITQRPSTASQEFRQSTQYFSLSESPASQPQKNDSKLQKLQIEILSDTEQKIETAFFQLKQIITRKT